MLLLHRHARTIFLAQGKYEQAADLYRRALGVCEAGSDLAMSVINNLVPLYLKQVSACAVCSWIYTYALPQRMMLMPIIWRRAIIVGANFPPLQPSQYVDIIYRRYRYQ